MSNLGGVTEAAPAGVYDPATEMKSAAASPLPDAGKVWDESPTVIIQGSSLRTCSFDETVDRVEVQLKTEGRPLTSNVELWQGPDNCPQKIQVYLEDGGERPFRAVLETPRGTNSVCVRNIGELEFPLSACLGADKTSAEEGPANVLANGTKPRIVQGGAVYTTPFPPSVSSVQIVLRTDGRPLNARVELLQGPNNIKQVMELYSEDGSERPFLAVVETPGTGNVVRIKNTSTIEFPMTAHVEPFAVDTESEAVSTAMTWSD
jgi:hypothetical protein